MSRTSLTALPRGCLKSARLVEPAMCQADSLHHDAQQVGRKPKIHVESCNQALFTAHCCRPSGMAAYEPCSTSP